MKFLLELGRISSLGKEVRMSRIHWPAHIVIDQDLHHGDPCIKGTRIPVSMIIGSLADGMTSVEIQAAYPQLKLEDIQAALAYVLACPSDGAYATSPRSIGSL